MDIDRIGAYAIGPGTVIWGLHFWVSFALGMGAAAIAGLVLGLTTLRLGGHYLAMITISFRQIFDLVLVNWIDVTRASRASSRRRCSGTIWATSAPIFCSAPPCYTC